MNKCQILIDINVVFLLQSYRGRKPNGPITPMGTGGLSSDSNGPVAPPQQPPSRPSPQPVPQPVPVQQQPMVSILNTILYPKMNESPQTSPIALEFFIETYRKRLGGKKFVFLKNAPNINLENKSPCYHQLSRGEILHLIASRG